MPNSWKVEVKVGNEWGSNALRFATEDEAKRAGDELLSRWLAPTDARAVESTDPVNYEFPVGIDRPRRIAEPTPEPAKQ